MSTINPVIAFFTHQGVPLETVTLILMLPLVATFIAFLRQVIGIKAFGIYTPLIITFAFLATNGLKYGIAIFAAVILSGLLMRFALRPLRLLYLPRVAIMVSVVAIVVLLMLTVGGSQQRTGLASVSIFPLLIMILLVEKFIAVQIEKGNRVAMILTFETLLISVFGYFIVTSAYLSALLQTHPWIILLVVPVNILLGKWTGLRLTEYFRFRNVIEKL